MVKVELEVLPPLSRSFKFKELIVDVKDKNLSNLLKVIKERTEGQLPVEDDGYPSPGYIMLMNGIDVRILLREEPKVEDKIKLTIIPVNHGG